MSEALEILEELASLRLTANRLSDENKHLNLKLAAIEANHAKALKQARESFDSYFQCFKADVIVTLKALHLCIVVSIPSDSNPIPHWSRDLKMQNLCQIIANQINELGDRKLTSYEDDF